MIDQMQKICVEKARLRLEHALACLSNMDNSSDIEFKKFQWGLIVQAVSNIYAALEQGSKISTRSKEWFNRIKTVRKEEPLLKYIRYCRNAEAHGAHETAVHVHWQLSFDVGEVNGKLNVFQASEGITINSPFEIKRNESRSRRNFVGLTTVFDKNGRNPFDPPNRFFDQEIDGRDAQLVANYILNYMKSVLSEAESLMEDST